MCWFAGFTYCDESLIQNISKTLKKRATDAEYFYVDNNYSFYHAHLKISDLDKDTSQPYINNNLIIGLVWEIYNKSDILKQLNIAWSWDDMTELHVITCAYEKLGAEFINILNGEFAISIYDIKRWKHFLFRDRWGVNNVYYRLYKWNLFFASEMKSLILDTPICSKKSMIDHMIFQFWISPETIVDEVFILRPGTYLVFEDAHISIHSFAPYKYREPNLWLIETLEESIKRRIPAFQKRIFLWLSGWPDSNLILFFLKKYYKWEIIAYSFRTKKNLHDIEIAQRNARKQWIQHLIIDMDNFLSSHKSEDLYTHEWLVNIPDLNKIVKETFPEYKDIKVEFWWDGKEELILWNNHYPYREIFKRYSYFRKKDFTEKYVINQEFLNKEMFDYNLQMIDKLSLRSGVERRLPFTDYEMLRFFKNKNYRILAEEFLQKHWLEIVSGEYGYDLWIKFENLYDSDLAKNRDLLFWEFKKHTI